MLTKRKGNFEWAECFSIGGRIKLVSNVFVLMSETFKKEGLSILKVILDSSPKNVQLFIRQNFKYTPEQKSLPTFEKLMLRVLLAKEHLRITWN